MKARILAVVATALLAASVLSACGTTTDTYHDAANHVATYHD